MGELKPCPFCGGKVVLYKTEFESSLLGTTILLDKVVCPSCMGSTGVFGNAEEAVKAWNRRDDNALNGAKVLGLIKQYQKKLKPHLSHEDLIRSNTCEEIMDIIESLKFKKQEG